MSVVGYLITHCPKFSFFIGAKLLKIQCSRISGSNLKRHLHAFVECDSRTLTLNLTAMGRKNKRAPPGSRKNWISTKNNRNDTLSTESRHGLKKLQPFLKVPTNINLVVIGTGGPGTSHSLLVTTEYTRYLFNCGEGTQRLAAMNKSLRISAYAKLSGLEHIFITHKSWKNTGGLLGIAMTLEGQKNPESKAYMVKVDPPPEQHSSNIPHITIHGPPGVENIAMMAKKFAVHANLSIVRHEGEFRDAALTITPIQIYQAVPEAPAEPSQLDDSDPAPAKRQRMDLLSSSPTSVAYAYICKTQPQLPKINVEKCLDAGVTIGPMVGCLQKGESVVLEDGRVVHPEQVRDVAEGEDKPFLILECPGQDYLRSLCESPDLQPYLDKSKGSFAVVVHMTPADIFNSADYQSWMRRFDDSTDHLVINRSAGEVDLIRVREHQAKLNIVNQAVFPILPDVEKNAVNVRIDGGGDAAISQPRLETSPKRGQVVTACSGLHYVVRRKGGLGFQIQTDEFECSELQAELLNIPEIQDQVAALRKTISAAPMDRQDIDPNGECLTKYPRVTFLGTGASEPNLIRAQSCVVVQVSKHSVIILDCGEDSYGQLHRFYGKAKANKILRKVKAIFISHLHPDHHLGLCSLLKERKTAFDEKNEQFSPALLIAPIQMRRWLKFYNFELEPITHLFRFVKHQLHLKDYEDGVTLSTATFEDVRSVLNLTEYKSIQVDHCSNAFGVTFTHANGFKLVYSGDTRPCDNLIIAGAGCDLLVHEATHEDALHEHAKASKHSTFSEAIDVGKRMKAKNVILTHFSQRYPHMVPLFDLTLPPNVGVAFDNMQVCPRTMKDLPHMIPALTTLFAEELQKFESKHIRRLREDKAKQEDKSSLCVCHSTCS